MSATGLEVFDKTIQTTNIWLDEMMKMLPHDKRVAWHVLGAVLRSVRDRVPMNLAVHFGAQLPLLIRGTYYDQWRPSEAQQNWRQNWRTADEFFKLISAELSSQRPVNPADAARVVFQVVSHYVDPHQVEKVRHALPEEVRVLWPAGARAQSAA